MFHPCICIMPEGKSKMVEVTIKGITTLRLLCPHKVYTHVCEHNILIKFDSHGNRYSHLGVTALYLPKTTWKISCLGQTSTLLGALASNIHICLSYMCRLSWIIIIALTFCGKESEVGASVSYGHISSFNLDTFGGRLVLLEKYILRRSYK